MPAKSKCHAIVLFVTLFCFIIPNCLANDGWKQMEKILNRIKHPVFPDKDFNITNYGAVSNGKTDCTQAFKKTIEAASNAGGGRVVVPTGEFLTGEFISKAILICICPKVRLLNFPMTRICIFRQFSPAGRAWSV